MLIQNTKELRRFIDVLGQPPYVALDTEFISENSYYPQLCLIQLGYGSQAAVIDTLSGLDLTPLITFLKSPGIIKVFHAAQQDLAIFWNDFQLTLTPVFDTQIAAMVCGFGDQVSYGQLVRVLTKTRLDKSAQVVDWSQRPLRERHIRYALADVTHLGPVYEKLLHSVERRQRSSWIAEEMQGLSTPGRYNFKLETQVNKLKMRQLSRRRLAVLHELVVWREQRAQAKNIPRGWVLKDLTLRDIASNPPQNLEGLSRVRGIGGNGRGAIGRELLQCLQQAAALPLEACPQLETDSSAEQASESVMVLLRALLKHVCAQNDVAAKLVANRAELEELALGHSTRTAHGWRWQVFGKLADQLLKGQIALALTDGEFKIVNL